MPVFRALRLGTQVSLYSASSLFGTQKQLTHPSIKCSFLPLWKNNVSQGSLLYNVFKLSCLGSLWFGTHWYYSFNPYIHLHYLWTISTAKDCHYRKYFIICVVYFYSKRPSLCRPVSPETLVELPKSSWFFLDKKVTMQYFDLPQEIPWLRAFYCNDTWTSRYCSF